MDVESYLLEDNERPCRASIDSIINLMADYGIPVEDVEKYQKWTGYFLIDIKTVFIITYVYISVVSLISTTANNEANQNAESPLQFNLTSRPEHTNVIVNSIDDSVLWSCRESSSTRDYYVTLYWMLLAMFSMAVLFYFVSKCFALWNIDTMNSLTDLWHMGTMKQLRKEIKTATYSSDVAVRLAKCYQELLRNKIPESVYNEMKNLRIIKRRKLIPYCSLIALASALVFGALSYDLHLISCINGIPEDSISYDNTTQTVGLSFPSTAVVFQRITAFLVFPLSIAVLFLAWQFYVVTGKIVDIMEVKVESEIKKIN